LFKFGDLKKKIGQDMANCSLNIKNPFVGFGNPFFVARVQTLVQNKTII
jgi:hypothetical protein